MAHESVFRELVDSVVAELPLIDLAPSAIAVDHAFRDAVRRRVRALWPFFRPALILLVRYPVIV